MLMRSRNYQRPICAHCYVIFMQSFWLLDKYYLKKTFYTRKEAFLSCREGCQSFLCCLSRFSCNIYLMFPKLLIINLFYDLFGKLQQ
ncbi:hypothetical protein VNO77_28808 [Canavalia gladiata]|uniref:Uncharacterized protein n=1 Tax=Canavalia gladiata TaxID=3824 RepID=A0AAN9Q7D5_CANGL